MNKIADKNLDKDIIYTYEYIVKSMMRKATYKSCKNIHSHYALNLENYLHFTSPIRRAPDIINHLILRGYTFDDSTLDNYCNYFDKSETIQLEIENIILKNTIFNNISEKIGEKINGIIVNIQQNFIEVYLQEIESTLYIHVSKLSNKKLIFNDNILSNEDDTYKLFQINKYIIQNVNIDIEIEIDK
jgi:ribonuclease R